MCGVAVPEFRRPGRFPIAVDDAPECVEDSSLIGANHNVGPICDCYRTLGIVAEGETWHAKNRGLFLKTAGIGEDNGRCRFEVEELEIAERLHRPERPHRESKISDTLAGSRMYRKKNRHGFRNLFERFQDGSEHFGI